VTTRDKVKQEDTARRLDCRPGRQALLTRKEISWQLDLGLPVSRAVRKQFSVVLSHSIGGILLR
jgi:hypothetical protein